MSCVEKVEWTKISVLTTPCVQDVVNWAVKEHNKETGEKLTLKIVLQGWYLEVSYEKTKQRYYFTATNDKGVVKNYEAIVCVTETTGHPRVRKLISFHVGYLDEHGVFWIEIPNIEQSCVQDVAKFAVAKHNEEAHDNLVYICATQGWYQEVDPYYAILFDIHLKTKDCFGRVREYKALVSEDKPQKEKIRTLKSFTVISKKC